ncbi:HD domain-containing phosphohydrolase [Conexibacter woesei]|uniref:HD domain-containing phosphohydrolase n=1 Tax=Conexibacter woesei TaxID=191495 RepID=UPI0006864287|nr:HD domain-containing phosphohydrolase [Conexibacter woesei]
MLVFVLPFGASVAFVWAVSRFVTAPDGGAAAFIAWWLALSAGGSLVMWLVDRAARRLLPLAALLQLSLVFPDQAPSRFRAAMDSGRVNELEDRLALAQRAANAETPAESARLLLTLVAALSDHDRLTRGHSERVRGYAVMIGTELGLSEHELDQLNWAALLHDIGKLEVSVDILNKPGRPDEHEWQQLKRHPLYGERFVEPMRPWLGDWADAVGYHHERWDGQGYPRGIEGDDIPLAGRIVAIADVFDVITSARSYKEAGSASSGREEIARCAGVQFDPRLVRAFLGVSLGRMRMVMGPLSWLAHLPIVGRLPLGSMAGTVWGAAGVVVATTASGFAGTSGAAHDNEAFAAAPRPAAVVQPHRVAPARVPALAQRRRHRVVARAARVAVPDELPPLTDAPVATPAAAPVVPAPVAAPEAPAPAEPAVPEMPAATPVEQPAALPPLTPEPVVATPPAAPAPAPVAPIPTPAPPAELPAPAPPVPNHAPTFTAGADRTVAEDSGPSATPGWATAIDAGPFEGGQAIDFVVDNDNNALFATQPAITPAGTLTFTPAPDEHGTARVTVRAHDDGGGDDTSAPQAFTITITSVNDTPSFGAGAAQAVLEDAGAQAIPGWATAISPGPANESSQAIDFQTSNDDNALFSAQPDVTPAGTLTYTPAPDANGTARVTVRAHDDGGGDDTSAPQTFTITITSVNDAPTFTAGADRTVREDDPAQTVGGWATHITPGPADESSQAIAFTTSNDNNSLFAAQPAVSPGGTLTFTPASGAHGVATVTITAHDDGGTADGGADTSSAQTFTITVLAPNHAPSFSKGSDPTVLEDAGPQTLSGWASGISAGPSYESAQVVSFTINNPLAALFAAAPALSGSGTLRFTPAANQNGAATFTVTAHDDGGTADGGVDTSAPQTFTVTVTPVNDAPSFAKGGDQSAVLNGGTQTIPGWATAISPGPADESGQNVTFTTTNNNPGLFQVQPHVDPDGSLVYQPGFSLLGSATVTVTAVDDGGTANGGINTSPPQTFTITVFLV